MRELSKEERALENGIEYDADLTDWHELEVQLNEIEQIYTVAEKIAMQQDEEIEVNKLTFSFNYELQRFHNGKSPSP